MFLPGISAFNPKPTQQAVPIQRSISALDFADDEAEYEMLALRAKAKHVLPVGTKMVVPRLLEWDEPRPRQQRVVGGGKRLAWLEHPTSRSPEPRRSPPSAVSPVSAARPWHAPVSVSKSLDRALGTFVQH
jgi:hypothetical protein